MGAPCPGRHGICPPVSHNANIHLPLFCLGLHVSSCTNTAQVFYTTHQLSWLLFFPVPKVFCYLVSALQCFCPPILPPLNSVLYSRAGHHRGHRVSRSLSMLWGTCTLPVEMGFIGFSAGPGFACCPLPTMDALCDPCAV